MELYKGPRAHLKDLAWKVQLGTLKEGTWKKGTWKKGTREEGTRKKGTREEANRLYTVVRYFEGRY